MLLNPAAYHVTALIGKFLSPSKSLWAADNVLRRPHVAGFCEFDARRC